MRKPHITFIRGHWWLVTGIGYAWSFPLACKLALKSQVEAV